MTPRSPSSSRWPQSDAIQSTRIDRQIWNQRDTTTGCYQPHECGPIVHSVGDIGIEPRRRARREACFPTRPVHCADNPVLLRQSPQIDRFPSSQWVPFRNRYQQRVVEQFLAVIADVAVVRSGSIVNSDGDVEVAAVEERKALRSFCFLDLQTYSRALAPKVREGGRDKAGYGSSERADGDPTDCTSCHGSQIRARTFKLGVNQRGVLEEQLSLRRQADAAPVRRKQGNADIPAQGSDLLRNGRRRQVQGSSGRADRRTRFQFAENAKPPDIDH
jgi:hypothetical protein